MKFKSILLLAVALGCGLVAMVGARQALSKEEPEDLVSVLQATADIQAGARLTEENTEFKAIPVSACVPGVITAREQIEERALKVRAVAGEYIMMQKLGDPNALGAATTIPDGMRVVTVSVNATKSHSGLLLPGNRVDVVCTFKVRGQQGMTTKTKTILQYIEVFATDTLRDAADNDTQAVMSKNVSLLVTPEQGALVMQAQDKGEITLAMRGAGDDTVVDSFLVDDSIFEDGDTFAVAEPVVDDVDNNLDIRGALQQEANAQQNDDPEPVEEVVVEAEDLWTITIYEGEEVRHEQVVMEDDSAGGVFGSLIDKYFGKPKPKVAPLPEKRPEPVVNEPTAAALPATPQIDLGGLGVGTDDGPDLDDLF